MKKFFDEFKEFISRGNVMDLAVGIVVGGAFTKIINSLVADIIMPLIGLLTGRVNISGLKYVIPQHTEGAKELAITYGMFLQSILDFLIIAFAIFVAIKAMNTARAKMLIIKEEEKKEEKPAPEKVASAEEVLLTEIRDLLKKSNDESSK